jgi:polysaccharide export outer membrane protein
MSHELKHKPVALLNCRLYAIRHALCAMRHALCSMLFTLCVLFSMIHISLGQGKEYLIGPRDVITIAIFAGGEKQQEVDLTVSGQGMINVPFIGSVKADGLTIPQLEALITKPLAEEYFVDPEVNIQIKEYHSLQYYISGAVKTPGLYEMTSEASLMELIAKAGGVLPERGNVAYILRESTSNLAKGEDIEDLISSKEPIRVDLKSLLDKGDMSHNLLLKSGDVVYIPLEKALNLAESNIYVEGEVNKPGVYSYQPGLTALNACIMAGGFGDFAAPNRTKIIRNTEKGPEVIRINLNDVKEGRIPDIELQPGDRINVPETWL